MYVLAVIFGVAVGFSLGLTGSGGSMLALPMLVYGLHIPMTRAQGISLAAVGTTSLVGAIQRYWHGDVEVNTGILFAIASMAVTPFARWLGRQIPEPVLM